MTVQKVKQNSQKIDGCRKWVKNSFGELNLQNAFLFYTIYMNDRDIFYNTNLHKRVLFKNLSYSLHINPDDASSRVSTN